MSARYTPGEYVDIAVRNARVVRVGQDDIGRSFLEVAHGELNTLTSVELDDVFVTITRAAPAEWPPRPGDLWRDREGRLHFASAYAPDYDNAEDCRGINDEGWRVVLLSQHSDDSCNPGSQMHRPEYVNQRYGPLTLVHREPAAQDGGEAR
ncbi:hypothetical protein [Thermomonospora cellulosilytica]|uniref:Uncharacterized protein n=1 Tax=Thermomonospora cellulosilytica TaxID=1411118 RepID=A0A7W3MXG2_9ACTN|nr:hypothetical protein [Thermomonospora cellulosilytica]MBA9003702.1 hypothetical protein [Thermomonospora cellulosilytica]